MRLMRVEYIALSLFLFIVITFLPGCNSNKYLAPGQSFLEDNSVSIRSKSRVRNKNLLQSELEQLYLQEETRTWIGIPRHAFYYAAQKKPDDTTGIQRWLRKRGDPPVILDSTLIAGTTQNMMFALRQHGYWNSMVDYKVKTSNMRSTVTYVAHPGIQWTIASVQYTSKDTVVQDILDSLMSASFLQPGEPVDVELYDKEKARITRALQNRGYANFFQNYIQEPIADSSNYQMHLEIEVTTPGDQDAHTRFSIGQITVNPEYPPTDSLVRDTFINGIRFLLSDSLPTVRHEVIARNIHLIPGTIYTRDAYDKTQRQLGRLEIFKFIALKPEIDPRDSAILNYRLSLVKNKKMEIGGDLELNYSTLSQAQRSLAGVGANINFRNRNLFRGAELFTTNIETGVEINLENSDIYSSNINVQNNLLIPKFIDPIRFYRFLNRIRPGKNGVLSDKTYGYLSEGNTNIRAGYQYLSLFNLYSYHSLNASLGYDAQPNPNRRLQLNHIGLDFFNPEIKPGFEPILAENVFLRESFRKQLFSGFLFRDFRSIYNSTPSRSGHTWSLIVSGELSGLEIFGMNTAYNTLAGESGGFQIGKRNPLAFSQFAKLDVDIRMFHPLASNQSLALRFASGVATPYGPFSSQVPYIKQFFVGGPSSIRAWQIRELGPGGYEDPFVDPNSNLPFYQAGDVKLEFSLEYRFDIAWLFEGAVFADAGNVWTLQEDASRPGSVISKKFVDQIAVGTGIGLRMDFTYFLIRLDFGYKLRSPYPIEGKHWLFDNFNDFSFRQFTTNFAIGYPF